MMSPQVEYKKKERKKCIENYNSLVGRREMQINTVDDSRVTKRKEATIEHTPPSI